MTILNNWYTVILIMVVFINLLPNKIILKYDRIFFSFLILITLVAIAFRPLNFNDDENYLSMLQDFKDTSPNDLGKISSLFYYLNLLITGLTNNFDYALKINFILIWIVLFISVFYENISNKTHYFTFLFLLFQVLFFIQLRNAYALVFLSWALIRILNNKKSIFLIIVASLFHYSVVPFILILYLITKLVKKNYKYSKNLMIFILFLTIALSLFFYNIYNNYIIYFPLFQKYLIEYISTPDAGNTSFIQLSLLLIHLTQFFNLYKQKLNNLTLSRIVITIYFGFLLGVLFYSLPLFQRIILPFYLFSIISYLILFVKSKNFIRNKTVYLMYFFYLAISINRISYFETWKIFS